MKHRLLIMTILIMFAGPALARKPANASGDSSQKPSQKASQKPSQKETMSIDDIKLDLDEEDETKSNEENEDKTTPESSSAKIPADIEAAILKAEAYEKKGDVQGVLAALRPKADRLPRKGLLILARGYRKSGDSTSEIKTLELCLAKSPKDYVVQTLLGDAYVFAKRSDAALSAYQEARTINSRYRPAYEGTLQALEQAGDRYEARTVLHDMIKNFGEIPSYLSSLCRLYSLDDFMEKAVEICDKAIKKDPKNPDNYVHLGMSLRDTEAAERASKILDEAAKKFPKSEAVQYMAGDLQMLRKDYSAAYRYFKQAAAADAKSTRSLVGLAISSFELQKNDESLSAFSKACQIDRKLTKDFRIAYAKLRARKDMKWQSRFGDALLTCE